MILFTHKSFSHRKVNDSEVSLDDRKQKHVSFDSSSILRSQTVGNMTETEVQKQMNSTKAPQPSTPSKSSERLLDGKKTPDYAMYSELFTPELARQIVLGKSISRFIILYLFLFDAHELFSEHFTNQLIFCTF